MSEFPFIARLKKRKIGQWALAYSASAFVVVQLVEVFSEPWGISPILQRALHVLLLFGFLATVVLAWYHGEKGRQRVGGVELGILTALVILGGASISILNRGSTAPIPSSEGPWPSNDGRPRVAVLPCTNASPDPSDAFRADGLHDEILLKLQKISSLVSINRASVLQFAETRPLTSEVAAAVGVGFVGECSVQRSENRFRVIFQLSDSGGAEIWAHGYNEDLTLKNILDIQIDIAEQVATAVGANLTPEETTRVKTWPTESLEAYDLYRLGVYHWNRFTEEGIRLSIDYFSQAIAVDSTFASAWAGLANSNLTLSLGFGRGAVNPHEGMPLARDAAQRALSIDPESGHAYSVLGMVSLTYDYDYPEAERLFARATELEPNWALGYDHQAHLFSILERHDEALVAIERARTLDPFQLINIVAHGFMLLHAGRVAEARAAAEHARELDPTFQEMELLAGYVAIREERYDEAIEAFLRVTGVYAQNAKIRGPLGFAYARSGNRMAAQEILEDLTALSEERFVNQGPIGFLCLGLGDIDAALDWYERGVQSRAGWTNWLIFMPGFEELQVNPRFQLLRQSMNLPR